MRNFIKKLYKLFKMENNVSFNEDLNLMNSKILLKDEIELIKQWLGYNFKGEILYSSSVDQKDPKEFHRKCDGISKTLILIKSDTDRRFGGFTNSCWSSVEGWIEGNGEDFIFSLDKKMKFLNDKREFSIYNHPNCFPCFGGGCDIGLLGNCFLNSQSAHSYFQHSYGIGLELDEPAHFYLAGNDEFGVENLEIYRIICE
jgi:TLD